jgi:hypothetical protein
MLLSSSLLSTQTDKLHFTRIDLSSVGVTNLAPYHSINLLNNEVYLVMTCDTCGTIERYGKRVPSGRMLCLDCWKLKGSKSKKSKDEGEDESAEESS